LRLAGGRGLGAAALTGPQPTTGSGLVAVPAKS